MPVINFAVSPGAFSDIIFVIVSGLTWNNGINVNTNMRVGNNASKK